ncbi:TPA: hypothetical protein U1212_002249 [Streptococcus suis]|nr:hypothetical protein [Streptococcus suis]
MENKEFIHCPALPQIVTLAQFKGDYNSYNKYLYYEIFLKELFNYKLKFNGKLIELKQYPLLNNIEDSYYHLTCKTFDLSSNEREPDLRRSERLCWLRPSIETIHQDSCNQECFLKYEKLHKGKVKRIHLLNPDDRYLIVLEDRKGYYLLVTAHYLHYDNALKKKLKEYNAYINQ